MCGKEMRTRRRLKTILISGALMLLAGCGNSSGDTYSEALEEYIQQYNNGSISYEDALKYVEGIAADAGVSTESGVTESGSESDMSGAVESGSAGAASDTSEQVSAGETYDAAESDSVDAASDTTESDSTIDADNVAAADNTKSSDEAVSAEETVSPESTTSTEEPDESGDTEAIAAVADAEPETDTTETASAETETTEAASSDVEESVAMAYERLDGLNESKTAYEDAQEEMADGNYEAAIESYSEVIPEDVHYEDAQEGKEEASNAYLENIKTEIGSMIELGNLQAALGIAQQALDLCGTDEAGKLLDDTKSECKTAAEAKIEYYLKQNGYSETDEYSEVRKVIEELQYMYNYCADDEEYRAELKKNIYEIAYRGYVWELTDDAHELVGMTNDSDSNCAIYRYKDENGDDEIWRFKEYAIEDFDNDGEDELLIHRQTEDVNKLVTDDYIFYKYDMDKGDLCEQNCVPTECAEEIYSNGILKGTTSYGTAYCGMYTDYLERCGISGDWMSEKADAISIDDSSYLRERDSGDWRGQSSTMMLLNMTNDEIIDKLTKNESGEEYTSRNIAGEIEMTPFHSDANSTDSDDADTKDDATEIEDTEDSVSEDDTSYDDTTDSDDVTEDDTDEEDASGDGASSASYSDEDSDSYSMYESVIDEYRAIAESGTAEDDYGDDEENSCKSEFAMDSEYSYMGYLIEDIDGNGTDELLIIDSDMVCAMYTIEDGDVVNVFYGWSRSSYEMYGSYIIYYGSNGAASYVVTGYSYEDGRLSAQFNIFVDDTGRYYDEFAEYTSMDDWNYDYSLTSLSYDEESEIVDNFTYGMDEIDLSGMICF